MHSKHDVMRIVDDVSTLMTLTSLYHNKARVAMATYMIYTTSFHKKHMCLGLCLNIKTVRHKCQSMPNISNLDGF